MGEPMDERTTFSSGGAGTVRRVDARRTRASGGGCQQELQTGWLRREERGDEYVLKRVELAGGKSRPLPLQFPPPPCARTSVVHAFRPQIKSLIDKGPCGRHESLSS